MAKLYVSLNPKLESMFALIVTPLPETIIGILVIVLATVKSYVGVKVAPPTESTREFKSHGLLA